MRCPFGRAAAHEHHVGVLGKNGIERIPDRSMLIAVDAAGEGDLGALWDQRLDFGAALGGDELSVVDDGRREIVVVGAGAGSWFPCDSDMRFEEIGGLIAE